MPTPPAPEPDPDGEVSTSDYATLAEAIAAVPENGTVVLASDMAPAEKITIERTTGDVNLNGCDANEIDVKTDTGDITMRLLSGKVFTANSNTGKVEVPDSIADGGICTVATQTGDIQITIGNE